MKKIIISIGVILIVVISGYFLLKQDDQIIEPPNNGTKNNTNNKPLTADNLIDCIISKEIVLYTDLKACKECIWQDKIFLNASPPAGPATKWSNVETRETGSPCSGLPCWSWGDRRIFGCRSLPMLNVDFECNLVHIENHEYEDCINF